MRYVALACDYDGTLASDGRVDEPTLAALERTRASGRHLILVTGRELDELLEVFPHLDLFSRDDRSDLRCWRDRGQSVVRISWPAVNRTDDVRRRRW